MRKSWREIKGNIDWANAERRLAKEHKAWEAALARFDKQFDNLVETSKKFSKQVTSKLT